MKRLSKVRIEKKVDVMFYRSADDPVEHYARDLTMQAWVKDL